MKKWLSALILVMVVFSLAACGQKDDKAGEGKKEATTNKVFKIGAIPDQNAADLDKGMTAVAKYLSEKTGLKVEFVPSVDYAALVTGFQRGEIHMAWFGGLTSVQARNLVPEAESIVQRPRDAEFHSVFITQSSENFTKLEDLKGKSFTFGSESSTSGHLMPRYYLTEAGIDPNKDFDGKPNFSGSHDTTYKLIESGAFKAGALNEAVWEAAVKEGKVDTNKVKVFYTTPAYFDYNWTVNSNVEDVFGKGTKNKVKEALLSITSEQKEIADLFQTDRFVETKNDNYKKIEMVAKELKIIK
ncbi:putative selenate ABC transporter substrate-binding protein [Neobacillus vireti]|uniref:Phosphate/phosphonate ABC transport system periplasmic phosphonate-binding protein n=1 Tax=Neobacillus vireti LMG 21834 TaxID=1131730 RepID=A0AB94ITA1_9BACI|nr:putative selenate ABC transporter substrate-binding protein [Neobacillus vireti]ETI70262.1 phosphate/phosphonate ABC transport system periplasmic phosphonate-binding protein [Neobacillus vireti LMG 21834]KLT15867.1 phosphate ABC transporter substrate-binding protein [Neobacillus vireti]